MNDLLLLDIALTAAACCAVPLCFVVGVLAVSEWVRRKP